MATIWGEIGEFLGFKNNNSAAGEQRQAVNDANAWSAYQAEKQMQFQKEQNQKAMDFEAEQARINREYQTAMSNSAHQREVADLKAAGLNPILSANSGASSPSGSTASGFSSAGAMGSSHMPSKADNPVSMAVSILNSAAKVISAANNK